MTSASNPGRSGVTSGTRSLPSAPHARSVGERRRVVARAERVRPHQQHGVVRLEHVDERAPVVGARARRGRRRRRARSARTARGARRRRRGPTARSMLARAAARRSSGVPCESTSTRGSPVTGTRSSAQRERRLEAAAHQVRRGGQDADPPRGAAVHGAEQAPREPAPGHAPRSSDARQPQRLGRVEPDPLERDAVPQLHDERARHGVAVDVAEPVRDDDDPRACGAPEAPQRLLRHGPDAAGRGIRLLTRPTRPARRRDVPLPPTTSHSASAPSPMPAPQPKTHSSRERGTRRVRRRPAAYSGMAASLRAFPAPNEKDATPRAYRGVASFSAGAGYGASSPSVTSTVCVLPSRTNVTVASLPAAAARTCAVRSTESVIGTPLNSVTMSPFCRPAAAAAPSGDDLGDVGAGDRRALDASRPTGRSRRGGRASPRRSR